MDSATKKTDRKILVTGSTFPRYADDTEPRFILDLSKELNKYYDVTALVPAAPGAADSEVIEGVKVERYHYFPVHSMETLCYPGAIVPRIREKKIRVLLVPFLFVGMWIALFRRRKKYAAVHCNWLIPQGIVQCMFSMPYVLTGHGGDVTSLNGGVFKKLKTHMVKKAAYVTTVSEDLAKTLLGMMPDKDRSRIQDKLTVCSMGCATTEFGREYRIENYFNQGSRRVVLFVGRLAEKKGIKYLIEAMKHIDNAVLVIAGKGPLLDELKEQVSTEGLNDIVKFIGAKTHAELRTIYASADVVAVPSITAEDNDKEGLPLVVLEAMASGTPVVGTRSGGIKEVIKDKENGLIVPEKNSAELANKIQMLLDDEQLRKTCIAGMKKTVEKYDYNNIGKIYADLIDKACRKAQKGPEEV